MEQEEINILCIYLVIKICQR